MKEEKMENLIITIRLDKVNQAQIEEIKNYFKEKYQLKLSNADIIRSAIETEYLKIKEVK